MHWRGPCCLVLAGVPSSAQTPAPAAPSSGLERQYDAAFQEMLARPADLDVLFKFATIASETGDLEGAISALERMLLINANLPRVRLELGVLYYRLGSYEVARTYLEGALKSPTLPPDVRNRAERFMADVVVARNSRLISPATSSWAGATSPTPISVPRRATSCCSARSRASTRQAVGSSDWGVVSSAQIRHTYDLGRQDKSAIETQFSAYVNRQFTANVAQRHSARPHFGTTLPDLQRHLRGCHRKAVLFGRLYLGQRRPLLRQLRRRCGPWHPAVRTGCATSRPSSGASPRQYRQLGFAHQQPVPRRRLYRHHQLPVRAGRQRHPVRDRRRLALPDRPDAPAELHAL